MNALQIELDEVASFDPRPHIAIENGPAKGYFNHDRKWISLMNQNEPLTEAVPEGLLSCAAAQWDPGRAGVDLRPHLFDAASKQHILLDSGSQVSAYPPEPGDQETGKYLKAVNGSRIKCYGHKQITIKIGRKEYHHYVIKADIKSPVLGWDFIRKNRFDFIWNDFGDITINDKKAKISDTLTYKALPLEQSLKLKKLARLDSQEQLSHPGAVGLEANRLFAQIASIESLGVEEEVKKVSLDEMENSPYKQLLQKYPNLLVQKFNSEESKSGVIHRIITKPDAKPCRAKVRKLLPGSPKEIKAKEAWFELVRLGIVEKVDPSISNTYSSPLHFAQKSDGSLRPVGDYRLLNLQTQLDQYPLPHLRDWTHKIAGCNIFSKVDLQKAFHQIILDKRDRFKTALATPWGMYQFRRLSMGMQNSAQAFQRLVDSVVGDMKSVFCYLDDLIIFSKSQKEHLETLEELFQKLDQAGLAIALSKCKFGVQSLDYLGYEVSSAGLKPLPKKTEALMKFPPPTKQKELLGFLGAINYYRASLPNLLDHERVKCVSDSPGGSSNTPSESSALGTAPSQILDPLYKLATCQLVKGKGQSFSDIWNNSEIVRNATPDRNQYCSI